MEPERKIEKWLRAFAKKRRADAGDFKLHPATRRLLQDEVARHAKAANAETEDDQPSLWQLFRQQWAFLIGFAMIIFLGAMMFLPNLATTKNRAQSALAMNKLKEVGVAVQIAAEQDNGKLPASLDELTNQLADRTILTNSARRQIVYLAAGKNLDDLESNDVLAFSPAAKDTHAILYADGRVAVADKKQFEELTNQKPVQLALRKIEVQTVNRAATFAAAPPPIEAPAAARFDEPSDELKPIASSMPVAAAGQTTLTKNVPTNLLAYKAGVSQITDSSSVAQNGFRNIATRKATPVLSAFQIQQNGRAVRVVDKDGSVYSGSLEMEKAIAQNSAIKSDSETLAANVQQFQNYFLRVTGTNQTLQQKVVFTANVFSLTNAEPQAQGAAATFGSVSGGSGGGGGGGNVGQSNQSQSSLWSNSRIAGEAVVAGTNKIEINAEPVP